MSGYPGAGKTTFCKKAAEALNYEYVSTGKIFRGLAAELGLSIEEFNKKIASDPELEREIDERQKKVMMIKDNIIVDGRMAPFFEIPFKAINVLLKVDPKESARRQLIRKDNAEMTVEEVVENTKGRVESEGGRYRTLYGIQNHFDEKYFQVIVDTTSFSPEETFRITIEKIKNLL